MRGPAECTFRELDTETKNISAWGFPGADAGPEKGSSQVIPLFSQIRSV